MLDFVSEAELRDVRSQAEPGNEVVVLALVAFSQLGLPSPRGLPGAATLPARATTEGFVMIRWSVLAGAAIVAGAALVTGASVPPKPIKPEEIKTAVIGQKTAYFNMAHVMREYKRAKTAVARLNDRRNRMTANLQGMRGMYTDLQKGIQAEKAKPAADPANLEQMSDGLLLLARRVEDLDRDINKLLNNQATDIIVELYDEIHATVATMAKEQGLVAVIAYPDAVTPEELQNPMIKELKLKPPAAQPFYLDPSVDYTAEIIQRLNARNPDDR
jgi:Skp family chaperone for outer membrane proteins